MIKFGKLYKSVKSGQHKQFSKEQRTEAFRAIGRKSVDVDVQRTSLTTKVFNRFLMQSGRGTKFDPNYTPETPSVKGRVWMQRLLFGKFGKLSAKVALEHERLETVKRAFGLNDSRGLRSQEVQAHDHL